MFYIYPLDFLNRYVVVEISILQVLKDLLLGILNFKFKQNHSLLF